MRRLTGGKRDDLDGKSAAAASKLGKRELCRQNRRKPSVSINLSLKGSINLPPFFTFPPSANSILRQIIEIFVRLILFFRPLRLKV
jgi:hypothetical protein